MEIKDANGATHHVTGAGQGVYNTVAGSLGLASFLGLGNNGGGGGLGLFGGGNAVTQREIEATKQISALEMSNAILTSEKNTTQQILELYRYEDAKREQDRARLEALQREYMGLITAEREARILAEKEQAVFNAQATQGLATTSAQIAAMNQVLNSITTSVIPQSKVCDLGCGCCGGNN